MYVCVFSFNSGKYQGVWNEFSLHWYKDFFSNAVLIRAFFTSIYIASISATAGLIISVIGALSHASFYGFKKRADMSSIASSAIVTPEVVLGLSLLMLFLPFKRGIGTIILAHIIFVLSYMYLMLKQEFQKMDHTIEEAAMDLGASPWCVFFKITIPSVSSSLMSAWLLAFALSLDDVVIASFTGGPGSSTLPILVFSYLKTGITPEMNCLCMLMVSVLSLGLIAFSFYIKQAHKKRLYI